MATIDDPQQGWEWCPGHGQIGERVDANWSRCPSCRWVGFRSKMPVKIPRHQRVIPAPVTTLF